MHAYVRLPTVYTTLKIKLLGALDLRAASDLVQLISNPKKLMGIKMNFNL